MPQDNLEIISNKGDRSLLHVKVAHDICQFFVKEADQEQLKRIEFYNESLKPIYDSLTDCILRIHEQQPFSCVYVDGYDLSDYSEEEVGDNKLLLYKPVKALVERGVKLKKTEHLGSDMFFSFLSELKGGGFNAYQYLEQYKGRPVKPLVKSMDNENPLLEIIREFIDVVDKFDYNRIRDIWIGRNIQESLKENERGILLLGKSHNPKTILDQLSNVRYSIWDPFSFLDEPQDS